MRVGAFFFKGVVTKDAYYFSHDSNARNDQKVLAVRMLHGMQGYGIYFGIIEIMREANAYQLPTKYEAIAYDLREPIELVTDIVTKFDLFSFSDCGGYFFSESLIRRMAHLDEIKTKRSEAGRIGGLASASKRQANVNDRSSSKVKESKVNIYKQPVAFQAPALDTLLEVIEDRIEAAKFLDFYASKGWMVGKSKMKDWRAAARNWMRNKDKFTQPQSGWVRP